MICLFKNGLEKIYFHLEKKKHTSPKSLRITLNKYIEVMKRNPQ